MKETIQAFLDDRNVAVAGASNKKDNFGRSLVMELTKKGYSVFPVNPRCQEIEGIPCLPSVKELPGDVKGLILAVSSSLAEEIVEQCIGTSIKRVWMIRGVGRGTYSEKAHAMCRDNQIEVVHGFCPLMFFGSGPHSFHLWIRKKFGKVPAEFN